MLLNALPRGPAGVAFYHVTLADASQYSTHTSTTTF
jgi:hypothetical protein